MKIIVRILIVLVIIIAIPLIIAAFVTNDYAVAREITINKPRQEVFDYLKTLKNQDSYNKWIMMDPQMKKEMRGTDGTVGFVYAWDSEKAGKGEQEIKSIQEGEQLNCQIRFIKPYEGLATTQMTTETVEGNSTKVKWAMEGKSAYPMNIMNLFIDDVLGKDLEASLVNLKNALEK